MINGIIKPKEKKSFKKMENITVATKSICTKEVKLSRGEMIWQFLSVRESVQGPQKLLKETVT
jgi:hypothetical protein